MAIHHLSLFAMLLLLFYFKLSPVNGGESQRNVHGKFVFQIVSYNNKGLLADSSRPCDDRGIVAKQNCEIYFVFSSYLKKWNQMTTPTISLPVGTGFFSIKDNEPGYRYEVEIPVSSDPNDIKVWIKVWDLDGGGNSDDVMEKFKLPPIKNTKVWKYLELRKKKRIIYVGFYKRRKRMYVDIPVHTKFDPNYETKLKLKYRLECNPSYGGLWCSQPCTIPESIVHTCNKHGKPICKQHYYPAGACTVHCKPEYRYNCNDQGKIVCTQFWKGSDCKTLKGYRSSDKYRGKIVTRVSSYINDHGLDVNEEYCDGDKYANCEIYFVMKSKVRNVRKRKATSTFYTRNLRKEKYGRAIYLTRNWLDGDYSNELEIDIPVDLREDEDVTLTVAVWEDDFWKDDWMGTYHFYYDDAIVRKNWRDMRGPEGGLTKILRITYKLVCYEPYQGKLCNGRSK